MKDLLDIAQDRKKLHKDLGKLLEHAEVKPMAEILSEPTVACCSLAKDFNIENNVLFTQQANWSFPRNIKCNGCKQKLAMSNELYDNYKKNKKHITIYCPECLIKFLNRMKKDT